MKILLWIIGIGVVVGGGVWYWQQSRSSVVPSDMDLSDQTVESQQPVSSSGVYNSSNLDCSKYVTSQDLKSIMRFTNEVVFSPDSAMGPLVGEGGCVLKWSSYSGDEVRGDVYGSLLMGFKGVYGKTTVFKTTQQLCESSISMKSQTGFDAGLVNVGDYGCYLMSGNEVLFDKGNITVHLFGEGYPGLNTAGGEVTGALGGGEIKEALINLAKLIGNRI